MNWNFEIMYAVFSKKNQELLLDGKWGIERETQRVTYEGDLALTPHPAAFGDKLKNKEITTDFSESQMELITPAFPSVEEVDDYLKYLHDKVESELGSEYLWPLSMPPKLPEEEYIPIARFDHSKEGQAAYIYRQGLANRYGKKMQMISGIHFNFSFGENLLKILYQEFGKTNSIQDFTDEIYFSVARNFLRYRWLIIYLFGASPSFDDTYDTVLKEQVDKISKCCPECCTHYDEYATSLRVSRFGYTNPNQINYSDYYNSKKEYIQGIRTLMSKRSSKFSNLREQLNNNVLQKDSEFYSPIRLKQIIEPGENQIDAIERRGVRYGEVRILDLNPFEKTGISLEQMHFLQVFLSFCLFNDNRPINREELDQINTNHHLVALSGRRPDLYLNDLNQGKISLVEWGEVIFYHLHRIAQLLDHENNDNVYRSSVNLEYQKLTNMSLLPSAMIMEEMDRTNDSFLEFGISKMKAHKEANVMEEML